MQKNPKPRKNIKGNITFENGARPKPHEMITAEALADFGYDVRFLPSNVNMGAADCYVNDIR